MGRSVGAVAVAVLATVVALSAPVAAREPRSLEQVEEALIAASAAPWISLEAIGSSAAGRPVWAVRLGHDGEPGEWRLLLIGLQHGDEPAGAEALVSLIEAVAGDGSKLPGDTTAWVVPVVNPDGMVVSERRNGAGADLNRDHALLDQPETRAVHALLARVGPHVVVDCHEFTRDSADYRDRGLGEWPLITMDTANHPLLPDEVYEVGLDWVVAAEAGLTAAGYEYRRYLVGGVPPDEELRPSTLDGDDARNGLALDGSLGFIIESGVLRAAEDPNADLERRVAAYLMLLDRFLNDRSLRSASLAAVDQARHAQLPAFLPTNVFWGNVEGRLGDVRVVDLASGEARAISTPNLMLDRVLKGAVPAPAAYMIAPQQAAPYRELLERHGIDYRVAAEGESWRVEPCRLLRMEDDDDPVYARYGGRQVVERLPAAEQELESGSLVVTLEPGRWRRAVVLLEPCQLFGLYQHERFRDTAAEDGLLPVARLIAPVGG